MKDSHGSSIEALTLLLALAACVPMRRNKQAVPAQESVDG